MISIRKYFDYDWQWIKFNDLTEIFAVYIV